MNHCLSFALLCILLLLFGRPVWRCIFEWGDNNERTFHFVEEWHDRTFRVYSSRTHAYVSHHVQIYSDYQYCVLRNKQFYSHRKTNQQIKNESKFQFDKMAKHIASYSITLMVQRKKTSVPCAVFAMLLIKIIRYRSPYPIYTVWCRKTIPYYFV